jgi:acetylornithine/succinyldiaminopimelate/putrescine aminotransferase/predicted amino acid dehydrogenase
MNGSEAYCTLVRPKLAELLKLLHLDVAFARASGCYLWPEGASQPVLDLVGGYGSLLFGHNHPELVKVARDYLGDARPIHAQGSIKPLSGTLAARLGRGDYRVLFANSGAEAVETALKHVMLESRGPIVALEGAFHGKTLGALQLTANPSFRNGFQTGLEVQRIPPNDQEALRAVFQRTRPAALFLELVQGEGGIVPLTLEFVTLARQLCTEAALVVDECQTGLGRTGKRTACEHYGLEPDLLLLSKALGGGIAKIAAVLIHRERYRPELGLIHTSTYGDDDFSAAIALRFLDLLTDDALATCSQMGHWLKHELCALASKYPDVLREVRGMGLMLGIEFMPPRRGFLLRFFGSDLVSIISGYLYHEHRIRAFPTLSNPWTLRIQPALVTPRVELERFVGALGDVCRELHSGDVVRLTRYFLPGHVPNFDTVRGGCYAMCDDSPTETVRAGWLFHLNDADDLVTLEPGFAELSSDQREEYLRHLESRIRPVLMNSIDVTSRTGQRVRFNAFLLPVTTRHIRQLLDAGDTSRLRALVESGIDSAEQLGCQVVSLGQYTSILMGNGLLARPRAIGLTTGNAYAVALALEAIEQSVPDLAQRTVAVVGAAGNIGSAVAELISWRCLSVLLIGRDKPCARARLRRLKLNNARTSTRLDDCRKADVVVVAISSPVPAVRGEHLAAGALVCDLSVPAGVDIAGRPDVRLIRGGIARMPHGEHHEGFPVEPGLAYACMAEAMILVLENIVDRSFTGRLTPDHVRRISAGARKHGFEHAEFPSPTVWRDPHGTACVRSCIVAGASALG